MSKETHDSRGARRNGAAWWLLPPCILAASVLISLSVVVFGTSEPIRAREAVADCSGALSTDYACYQKRYQGLVQDYGVEAAFTELKDEHTENEFVRANCHQLTHTIGRAAADLYGDIQTAYARGDDFCTAGYHHGVMEKLVAEIGYDRLDGEAGTLCSGLRQKYSFSHYDCAHGLGHGFMGVLGNDLFGSLEACDALADGWEREPCYAGVFMQNMMAEDGSNHPSKYLRADRPLYPCTDVQARYKASCYRIQASYALWARGNDFAEVFELCATVEEDFRPACYQGLGGYASVQGIQQNTTGAAQSRSTSTLCQLGENHQALSNCVVGAAKQFILHYRNDARARAFCESFDDADLRAVCLQEGEEYYKDFEPS